MTRQFHNVQALRAVACLLVVLVHLRIWDEAFVGGTAGLREVAYFGFAGVDLFFVLSGFVITATNRKHYGRPAAVPGYLFRRAWRIYPTYWAATALAGAAVWAVFGRQPLDAEVVPQLPELLALVPVQGGNPLIPQAWTLSYELMFYAVFGVLLVLPPRAAAVGLAAWAAVVLAATAAPVPGDPWAVLPVSPFVLEFLGGSLVAGLTSRGARGLAGAAFVAALVWATAGAALVAAGPVEYGAAMSGARLRVLVFGPAAVLLVYAAVAAEGRWPRRVPRWLLLTGDASYSLYLTHSAVYVAAVYVGTMVPHTRLAHLVWLATTFAAAVAFGVLFFVLVERPLLNLGRRRRTPEPAAAPEAVSTRRAA